MFARWSLHCSIFYGKKISFFSESPTSCSHHLSTLAPW